MSISSAIEHYDAQGFSEDDILEIIGNEIDREIHRIKRDEEPAQSDIKPLQSPGAFRFCLLSKDIIIHVFQFLTLGDLCKISSTSKKIQELAESSSLWVRERYNHLSPCPSRDSDSFWKRQYKHKHSVEKSLTNGTFQFKQFEAHQGALCCVQLLGTSGQIAVTCGQDEKTILWDLESGQQCGKMLGHTKAVWSVHHNPLSDCFITSSGDGTVRVWDSLSLTCRSVFRPSGSGSGVRSRRYSRNAGGGDRRRSSGAAAEISDRDRFSAFGLGTPTLGERGTCERGGGEGLIVWRATSDEKCIYSGCVNGLVTVHDIKSGKQIKTFTNHSESVFTLQRHGHYLLSAGADRRLLVRDLRNNALIVNVPSAHLRTIFCGQMNDSVIMTGSGCGEVKIWDINGNVKKDIPCHSDSVWCLQFDSFKFCTGSVDKTVKIWDMESCEALQVLEAPLDAVFSLSCNETRVVAGGGDGILNFWDFGYDSAE